MDSKPKKLGETQLAATYTSDALYTVIYPPVYKANYAFRGYIKSLSSINSEGVFDVLPQHENFVSVIQEKITILDNDGKKYEIAIGKALIEASNNNVRVFVEF